MQGETALELLHDRQFQIRHVTQSRNYDFHKLVLPLNIYRLGHTYIDIACAGQDDYLQLGSEEGLLQVTQRSKRQPDSPSGTTQSSSHDPKASPSRASRLSHPKNKFDSLSSKYNQELLLELEHQKQRLMNKAKTLDPSGQTSGAGNQSPGPQARAHGKLDSMDAADELAVQMEGTKSDADIMEGINRQI